MRTVLIDGEVTPSFDVEIRKMLKKPRRAEFRGEVTLCGVRNLSGRLYRIIEAEGIEELIRLQTAMRNAGFKDEMDVIGESIEGCDSIWST